MNDEVYRAPVVYGGLPAQEDEPHTHIVKESHFEKPADPVKKFLLAWSGIFVTEVNPDVLGYENGDTSQEAKVVAWVNTMPKRTHCHRHSTPEKTDR